MIFFFLSHMVGSTWGETQVYFELLENEGNRLIQEQITANNYQSHKVLKGFYFCLSFY